jgi:hypothetical protein
MRLRPALLVWHLLAWAWLALLAPFALAAEAEPGSGGVDPAAPVESRALELSDEERERIGAWARRPADGEDLVRPDAVSAFVTARAEGRRVEIEELRTETARVFVLPNGMRASEQTAAPARVREADGSWQDVDVRLVERDGRLEPRVSGADVSFSAGGSGPMVELRMADGGKMLFDKHSKPTLGWRSWLETSQLELVQ